MARSDSSAPPAHLSREEEIPHGCLNGYVYIGHMVEGEDGEEVETYEAVPCRRCADSR